MSVLNNITKKVTDTAKAAARKSGGVVEVTKLNMGIGTEEEKVRKIYTDMGRILYDDHADGKNVEGWLLVLCEKVDAINGGIGEMKQKILELRNVKVCHNCATELDIDMSFCYKCGKKQEVAAVEKTEDSSIT
jgi:hypothetical protein